MARQTGSHTFIKSLGNTTGYKKIYTKKNNNFEKTKAGLKKSSIDNNPNLAKIKSNNSEFYPANWTAIFLNKMLKNIIQNKSGSLRYRFFKTFLSYIRKESGTPGSRTLNVYDKIFEMKQFVLGDKSFSEGFGLKFIVFYDVTSDAIIFRPIEDINYQKMNLSQKTNVVRFGLVLFSINNMLYNGNFGSYFLPTPYNYNLPFLSYSSWLEVQSTPIPTFDTAISVYHPKTEADELICVGIFLEQAEKNNLHISKLRYISFASIEFCYNNLIIP